MNLDNVIWRALSGSHARISAGTDRIRRYANGFPALVGYADPENPDFAALATFCEPGQHFYCAYWRGPEPAGWRIDVDASACAMLWSGATPNHGATVGAIRLAAEHVPQMAALAAATKPGPFAARPLEIGEWYGILEGDRLVAMAGERLHAGELREVSGVCTAPECQGRGYARRLTELVVRSQLARGLKPFLHVASSNTRARSLYERMGFVVEREVPLRVISRR